MTIVRQGSLSFLYLGTFPYHGCITRLFMILGRAGSMIFTSAWPSRIGSLRSTFASSRSRKKVAISLAREFNARSYCNLLRGRLLLTAYNDSLARQVTKSRRGVRCLATTSRTRERIQDRTFQQIREYACTIFFSFSFFCGNSRYVLHENCRKTEEIFPGSWLCLHIKLIF